MTINAVPTRTHTNVFDAGLPSIAYHRLHNPDEAHTKTAGVGSKMADAATDNQGSIRPAVPLAGIAVAAGVAIGIFVWIRRR